MARPDPRLLVSALYPFWSVQAPRFRDVDANGHLNNGAIADAFETARVLLDLKLDKRLVAGTGPAVAIVSMTLDYLAESTFPQALEIGSGVAEVGNSSWKVFQLAVQEDRVVALCRCTLVHLSSARALPVSTEWRASLEEARLHEALSAGALLG